MGILLNWVSPSLVNVSTKPRSSTMPCTKNFRRVAKNLWLSVFTTIQNLPKDELRMDHMDLTSSMLSAIICKRDNTDTELVVMALTKHHPTEDTILTIDMTPTNHHLILTMVMTRMKNHPTEDTNLIMAMTLTKNHPMDMILTTVMTPTSHYLTDMILISHPTMNMKNLMRNHTNQSMKTSHLNQSIKTSHTNLNTSKSHTMIMKNLITRIHMNKNMNQSRTNQNMSLSHTMNMKNLLTRNHTNKNISPSHTMIMKPLITIPMSPMIITQSLSMSITKNIPIHLPSTSMATNNLSTRNMAAVIITTKNHMGVTK